MIASLHHVLMHCQRQDSDLWPEAVTTAFQSAMAPVPGSVAAINTTHTEGTKSAITNGAQDNALQSSALYPSSQSDDVFGPLCCGRW